MTLHKFSDRENTGTGPGTVDVRDWDVRTRSDDEDVGKVRDLLVDDGGKVRYLDVDLGIFSKRVLVPVERTTPDAADEVVWVDGLDKDGFKDIPKYDGDIARLNADYEQGLLRGYSAAGTTSGATAGGATAAGRGSTMGRGSDGGTNVHRARSEEAERRAEAAEDRSKEEKRRAKEEEKRAEKEEERAEEESERVDETREAAPVGDSQLGRLGEMSDYEVADYHEDVRGWDVVASDDQRIGKVKDLVADTAAMKVRYLDVELDGDYRRSDEEGRILVPIEHARILKDPKSVRVDSVGSGQARDIPTHRGEYDRDYETRLDQAFPRSATRNPNDTRR